MTNKEKRLIFPLTVFWTLVVTIGMMSLYRYSEKMTENNKPIVIPTIEVADSTLTVDTVETTKAKKERKIAVSEEGIAHIKSYESLSLTPYTVNSSHRQIGYGHLIKKNDPLWVKQIVAKYKITNSDAEKIFRYDIDRMVNPALKRMFAELENNGVNTDDLSQGFINGLGSLIYNCGEDGVRKTQFYRLLKKGHISKAIAKVEKTHVYLRGHYTRRLAEAEMMRS